MVVVLCVNIYIYICMNMYMYMYMYMYIYLYMYMYLYLYMYIYIYIRKLGNKRTPWNWFVYMLPIYTYIHRYGSATNLEAWIYETLQSFLDSKFWEKLFEPHALGLDEGSLEGGSGFKKFFLESWILNLCKLCKVLGIQCAYFSGHHPHQTKHAMPIHLKTLNVLSAMSQPRNAMSQPRNAATSRQCAHELLRHLGCSRASWELFCLSSVLPFLETSFYVCSNFHKKDH